MPTSQGVRETFLGGCGVEKHCSFTGQLNLTLREKLGICRSDHLFLVLIDIFQRYMGVRELVGDSKGVPASEKVKSHWIMS